MVKLEPHKGQPALKWQVIGVRTKSLSARIGSGLVACPARSFYGTAPAGSGSDKGAEFWCEAVAGRGLRLAHCHERPSGPDDADRVAQGLGGSLPIRPWVPWVGGVSQAMAVLPDPHNRLCRVAWMPAQVKRRCICDPPLWHRAAQFRAGARDPLRDRLRLGSWTRFHGRLRRVPPAYARFPQPGWRCATRPGAPSCRRWRPKGRTPR